MSEFEQSLLMWAITGIASGAIGYLIAWWRTQYRRDTAIYDGVRVLLLCELERQQREMVANGGIADNESKSRAQTVYDAYHQLGGNGHGTQVNNDIQSAPITRKPL